MAHILVVEDDASNQVVIRKALTKIGGFQVTITESVEEVLRCARAGEAALIVMDVSLSNSVYQGQHLDGVAITKLLKGDAAARAVPVLLATAYAMQGDAERLCAACGANDYISKPFIEPRELVEKVWALLALPASGLEREQA